MLKSDFIFCVFQSVNWVVVVFSALFLIIIPKHFKQNLFLWASSIVWCWWVSLGLMLGSSWLAGLGYLVCSPIWRMTWWKSPGTWLIQVARRDEQTEDKNASLWKSSLQVSTAFSMLYVYFTWLSHWHIPINQSTNKGTRQFQVGICSVKRLKGMGC